MKFVSTRHLSIGEARELEHLGFIVQFVTFTLKGLMFNIFVK